MSQQEKRTSIESWILMSLVYRDLDDGDYNNALLLSERLYAIDSSYPPYQYLYAKCLFQLLDYTATYGILKSVESVPCLNLFAKSCLELGKLEENDSQQQRQIWEEGVQALKYALNMKDLPEEIYWGDDLSSATIRNHMPSKSSICSLLGDLYIKLDNIHAAEVYYKECLKVDPYKIATWFKLCDIAPDCTDFDKSKLPQNVFTEFSNKNTTLLRKSSKSYLPANPIIEVSDIEFNTKQLNAETVEMNSFSMPKLKENKNQKETSIQELRNLILKSSTIPRFPEEIGQSDIERAKNIQLETVKSNIRYEKASEEYKNKHGLHKKPPVQVPQKLKVDLAQLTNENQPQSTAYKYDIKAPRLTRKKSNDIDDNNTIPQKKFKPSKETLEQYFLPSQQMINTQQKDELVINSMNKVINVLRILASGYLYKSFYQSEQAALELQKLDDKQYNSARVLCILGKAYYDAGDHTSARLFFKQSFIISPWYCDEVPTYSTCLWYLSKEKELNLLAFSMKDNKSHLFEAYIAAGNWTKCAKGGNEATQWFQKAVKMDSSKYYGHALLGYEEWEKGNCLGAKQHFAKSMIANKRSYIGWYGMATAYQGMEEYAQAKTLLTEAIRLHPRHHIVLATMAEVLLELGELNEALRYAEESLSICVSEGVEKLKEKLKYTIDVQEQSHEQSQAIVTDEIFL